MPKRPSGFPDLYRVINSGPETLRRDKRIHLTIKGRKNERVLVFRDGEQAGTIVAVRDVMPDMQAIILRCLAIQKGLDGAYINTFPVHRFSLPDLP